jgi:flagellar basal body P-ring formation protein FlgA
MKSFVFAFCLLAVSKAVAAPWHSTAQIDETATRFLAGEGYATVATDHRLRMQSCGLPLQAGWLTEKRNTVVVSCDAPVPWRVSLPVQRSRAVVTQSVTPSLAGLFDVRAGDMVRLRYEAAAILLDVQAVALSAGRRGERLRVRTAVGQPVLLAEVISPGYAKFLAKED